MICLLWLTDRDGVRNRKIGQPVIFGDVMEIEKNPGLQYKLFQLLKTRHFEKAHYNNYSKVTTEHVRPTLFYHTKHIGLMSIFLWSALIISRNIGVVSRKYVVTTLDIAGRICYNDVIMLSGSF